MIYDIKIMKRTRPEEIILHKVFFGLHELIKYTGLSEDQINLIIKGEYFFLPFSRYIKVKIKKHDYV